MSSIIESLQEVKNAAQDQTAASQALSDEVSGKVAEINSVVSGARQDIDNFISGERSNYPFYRLTKNQSLEGVDGSVPDHWSSASDVTYTLVQTVLDNVAWGDRTDEEKELLDILGGAGVQYTKSNFNIWRMDWTSIAPEHTLYQKVNHSVGITVCALTKVLSGSISNYWATGSVVGEWKVSGMYIPKSNLGYVHCHPQRLSETGSMLFALPACVAGRVPFESGMWGDYPYIGDGQDG